MLSKVALAAQRRTIAARYATPVCAISKVMVEPSWKSLGAPSDELRLEFTLPTGQTFRWRQTDAEEYTGVIGQRVVRIRQLEDDVEYSVLARGPDAPAESDHAALTDYFNLGYKLSEMSHEWAARDGRFAQILPYFPGVRMLRQDPVETLFAFLCSQNNHITRIHGLVYRTEAWSHTSMLPAVERLCADYGTPLLPASVEAAREVERGDQSLEGDALRTPQTWSPAAGGAKRGKVAAMIDTLGFYAFPTCEQLSHASEEDLRAAGFGYRAKYVVQCSRQLMERQGGPETWLRSLKDASYEDAAAALCELPGVGPKVAACICLFSLDHLRSIPVDTHVWQLAVRHYAPELAGKSLTARVHKEVQRAFETRFGDKCGWAHNVLFVSEVPAFRQRLPEELRPPPTPKKSKGGKKKRGDKDGIGEEARDVGGESVNELDGRETGENAVDLGEKEEGGTVGEAVTGVKRKRLVNPGAAKEESDDSTVTDV